MKYAVVAPVAARVTADPSWMASFARHLEACGFDEVDVVEHTVLATHYDSMYPYDSSGRVELSPDCPVPDPLDLLAFLAGHTTRLGLATGVLVLPNHHPVVLAKRAAKRGGDGRREPHQRLPLRPPGMRGASPANSRWWR